MKLGDSDGIKRFRTRTPAEITKLAEKARVKAAKATYRVTLASAKFVAAGQLKSGDISLSLSTAKEAEIMRCHRKAGAFLTASTYERILFGALALVFEEAILTA